MSENTYLPLFRKYRPQSFKDLVGQEALVKALTNAIELNRIANAYLFCGPRGTGKTSSARIFAKSLNCINGPTTEPCQTCPSCVDITNAVGLDVIEIDAASNRGIQDAKDLISQVQYAPINGKYKIFIIDEVHMLSNDAFNALLKTFEEPPKNVIFILATTEPHKVLETIVSRCQRFDFRRITIKDITKRLREIADIENIKITDNALFTIAKNVSGGMRDSLALLDQVSILGVKEEIDKELIEDLLGKVNFDVLLNLLKDIYDENIENSICDINNIYSKGNEPRNLAENFIEFLRNVVIILNSKNSETISNFTTLIKDDIDKINALNFEKDKIVKILSKIIEYYKEIKVSTNPYLWMELAAISSCKLNLTTQVQQNQQVQTQQIHTIQATQQIKQIKQQFSPQVQTPINAQQSIQKESAKIESEPLQTKGEISKAKAMEIQAPVEINNVCENTSSPIPEHIAQNQDSAQIWSNILSAIPSIPTRSIFSQQAKLIGIENNVIKIGFLVEAFLNNAKSPQKFAMLESSTKKLYPNLSVELSKITAETKIIETIPKTIQRPQVQVQQAPRAQQFVPKSSNQPTEQYQESNSSDFNDENNDEDNNDDKKANYSPQVEAMIEQFNGRIIE